MGFKVLYCVVILICCSAAEIPAKSSNDKMYRIQFLCSESSCDFAIKGLWNETLIRVHLYESISSMARVGPCSLREADSLFACTHRRHYTDVLMSQMASQITSLGSVYSTVYSCEDQRKHQSSSSLAFVRIIHRGPVNSPHKRSVTRKMLPFDDVIMGNVSH